MPATPHKFPNLVPSSRVYTPGTYPQKEFQGLNGAVTTLQYGVQAIDSKLEMQFQNITDDEAYAIIDNYQKVTQGRDDRTGEHDYVQIEAQVTGISSTLLRYEIAQDSRLSPEQPLLRYRYQEPPKIISTFPGRSTVSVVLRGYLDGASNS